MLPHDFQVGDIVRCNSPGSWTHGRVMTVTKLNVTSSDEIHGHRLQAPEGVTVLPPHQLQNLGLLDLAKAAMARQKAIKDEDVQAWAERLAADVGHACD